MSQRVVCWVAVAGGIVLQGPAAGAIENRMSEVRAAARAGGDIPTLDPSSSAAQESSVSILPEAPPEAPPPPPRHKGFVLESRLGALGFLGQFRHVAPTGAWLQTQLGYEFFKPLMAFAYGELALSDTSVAQDESHARAFPLYGFGTGLRLTVHATERVAVFGEGTLGALKTDIATGALANLGFRKAESLSLSVGARVGVEWYQLDRHLALGLAVGVRDATGFARSGGSTDTPLMIDGSVALRYTF